MRIGVGHETRILLGLTKDTATWTSTTRNVSSALCRTSVTRRIPACALLRALGQRPVRRTRCVEPLDKDGAEGGDWAGPRRAASGVRFVRFRTGG